MRLIESHLDKLKELLNKMVYVSEGDMVLAEHTNTFIEFTKTSFDALKILYNNYLYKTEKKINIVEFYIQVSESRLKMLSEVKYGDVVATKDHNILIDVLKAIQVCLVLIGGLPYP